MDKGNLVALRQPTPCSVLVVDQSGQLGGAELSLIPVVLALGERCEVVLLADGPFRHRLEDEGVAVLVVAELHVARINKDRLFQLSALRGLPGLIRQVVALAERAKAFDLIYLNTQKALIIGALSKPLHRKPVVWHLHDIMTREHFGWMQLLVVKFVVRRWVDHVIANSQAAADALTTLTRLPAASTCVVHNGISAKPFQGIDDADRAQLRRRLGLPENGFLAGIFGRLSPWKGQHIVLEALVALADVHLVIVGAALFGETAYDAWLHQRAAELGVAERVSFVGFQDDVPAMMKAMDVIVHASTSPEPFGRVVVEGMLARRPVIATRAGGVLEIIEDQVSGLLVEPGDAAAMQRAIAALVASPTLGARLVACAWETATSRFSEEAYVANMVDQIEGVMTS